jgi:alpha 1,3-glucosidase
MLLLLLGLAVSVDKAKYRTCENSKFCTRDRFVGPQNWTLAQAGTSADSTAFEGVIADGAWNSRLKLEISFLLCGAARVRIAPFHPEPFTRFDCAAEPTIVNQNVLTSKDKFEMSHDRNRIVLTTSRQRLEIEMAPFLIVVSDRSGHRMTINPDDSAIFEAFRDKEAHPELFEGTDFGGNHDGLKNGPTSVAIDIQFHAAGARFSGLPAHTLPLTLGQTVSVSDPIRFFNTDIHQFEVGNGMSMYGAIPFLMARSQSGCDGVFWCNPSETWVDLTTDGVRKARFMSEGGLIDFFVFSGPAKAVLDAFTEVTGRPQLLPLFGLGFHQCRWGYMTADEVRGVSAKLENELVPHDVLWLDLDHTDNRQYFTFHPTNFQDPERLQSDLDSVKRKLVILVDPHLRADHSYGIYASAVGSGFLTKNSDGTSDFIGECWPGRSSWPDFLNPAVRAWWETHHFYDNFRTSRPNLFIWNDMNEISVFNFAEGTSPRDLVHYGDVEEREVHNIYGHMMLSATFGGLVKRNKNQTMRPFILTRSFFAGSQRYAAAWTGDNAADWAHLRSSIPLVLSWGLAGMVYSGSDVGGFFESPDPNLLSRWYQVGAWLYPFFRCHCHHLSNHREVYTLHNDAKAVAREAIADRYRLLPYWYTLARRANLTGEPIVRALWWEFPDDCFLDVDDRAMIGSALLVVPFLNETQDPMTVELPDAARWYRYGSLEEVRGSLVVPFDGGRTPVFVRGGSVFSTKRRIRKSSTLMFWDPFALTVALDADGKAEGDLYVDDGETFDYARGGYVHRKFVFADNKLVSVPFGTRTTAQFVQTFDVAIELIQIAGLPPTPTRIIDEKRGEMKFTVDGGVVSIRKPMLPVRDDFRLAFEY